MKPHPPVTPELIQYLESIFPDRVPRDPSSNLSFHQGQQSVLDKLRDMNLNPDNHF
jgi:hypothetical protein